MKMITDTNKYNGWTNWDTWNCNLWLNNDYELFQKVKNCKSANDVKDLWVREMEDKDDINTNEINFEEIYQDYKLP